MFIFDISNKLQKMSYFDYLSKICIMNNKIIYCIIHTYNIFKISTLVTESIGYKFHICLFRFAYVYYTIKLLDIEECLPMCT